MLPALRATWTSHTATVRASVELGVGLGWEGPGSLPEGIEGPRNGGRPRTQSPGCSLWYWSQRTCPTDLVDKCDISSSALPSFPHNDTGEQVLPAGQIVSKYPEVIGTHETKLCADDQFLS